MRNRHPITIAPVESETLLQRGIDVPHGQLQLDMQQVWKMRQSVALAACKAGERSLELAILRRVAKKLDDAILELNAAALDRKDTP